MDDDGNRDSVAVTPYGQGTDTTNYTSNNLNQYTAVGAASPTHDDNGNLTDDGTYDFEYDYKNQIVRVKEGETTVATYKYDALGRRVEKDVDSAVERFVYSGVETVVVYDGSNNWLREFVFGSVIDEVLMMNQPDVLDFDGDEDVTEHTRHFYHRNALGSVMEITEMDEDVAVSYRYDPYGAVTITRNSQEQSSDPLGNPWTYTARFTDEETGLYYYRARAYSPVTERFVSRDPLNYAAGSNLYEYGGSAPTTLLDPMGLAPAGPLEIMGGGAAESGAPPDAWILNGFREQWAAGGGVLEVANRTTWLTPRRDGLDVTYTGSTWGPRVPIASWSSFPTGIKRNQRWRRLPTAIIYTWEELHITIEVFEQTETRHYVSSSKNRGRTRLQLLGALARGPFHARAWSETIMWEFVVFSNPEWRKHRKIWPRGNSWFYYALWKILPDDVWRPEICGSGDFHDRRKRKSRLTPPPKEDEF
jgi:RHS repeat-associated protein